ncbi:MAG: hypothetical protein H6711_02985 [Myxococcales bacterium]|nr:hypothetical protein [Myxococcales bacterium]
MQAPAEPAIDAVDAIDDTTPRAAISEVASALPAEAVGAPLGEAPPGGEAPPALRVLSLARYTIPIHALLPLLIWALGRAWEGTTTITLVVVHVAFPLVLGLTYPLWRGQGGDLIALLVANHIVTFGVGFLLIVLTS